MAVTSREIYGSASQAKSNTSRYGWLCMGLVAIFIGFVGWCIGGRHTLIGAIGGLNMFFGWLGLPLALPMPVAYWILLFVPIALLYSIVELRTWPGRPTKRTLSIWFFAVLVYGFVMFTDILTTKIGVSNPGPGVQWPLTIWLARNDIPGWIWSGVLTVFPEQFILFGVWCVRQVFRG